MSPGDNARAIGTSPLAIKTSMVSAWTTSGLTSGGFSDRPASIAATPPAAMATVRTTTRAAFIRSLSQYGQPYRPPKAHGGQSDRLHGFHQLKVKVWLTSRI